MSKIKTGLKLSPKSFKNLDGRTRTAKAFIKVRRELKSALGGDLSPQESILVDRVVFLLYKITTFENAMLQGHGSSESVDAYFLAWVNTLRRTLESLGLERRVREMDLNAALAQMADEDNLAKGATDGKSQNDITS